MSVADFARQFCPTPPLPLQDEDVPAMASRALRERRALEHCTSALAVMMQGPVLSCVVLA